MKDVYATLLKKNKIYGNKLNVQNGTIIKQTMLFLFQGTFCGSKIYGNKEKFYILLTENQN